MIERLEDLRVANSFSELPHDFYTFLQPQPLPSARLLHANEEVGRLLGMDPEWLDTSEFLDIVSGREPLPGGKTLAAVYSGHLFGVWAGQLGDGRAHLLGEVISPSGRWELQLKLAPGDSILAHGRRSRGIALFGARISGVGSHGRPRYSHHPRAGARHF